MIDISVVIPTYEADYKLCRAIDSVISQLGANIQIVVVDDGSKSPSDAILRTKYRKLLGPSSKHTSPSIKYLRQNNKGAYLARIFGVENCDGRYIKFLDQDDILLPGSFAKELLAFDQHTDVVMSDWHIANEAVSDNETTCFNGLRSSEPGISGSEFECKKAPHFESPIDDFLTSGGVFTSAAMYRASLLKKVLHPVAEFIPVKADDWLIFAQVCLGDARYKTIQNTAYIWNQSKEQLSQQSRDLLIVEHFSILNWIEKELRQTNRLTSQRKLLLANYYAKHLLEAYSQNKKIYSASIERINFLDPHYSQQHGNRVYRYLCNLFGLSQGVKYYSFFKSILVTRVR